MLSTYERNYNLIDCNDKDGYFSGEILKNDINKNEFEHFPDPHSPASMITPTKESSSPSSSTEPTSMRSDKSGSRVPSEDKMDVTGLEIPEMDRSTSDISLSPTRERKLDPSLMSSCYSTSRGSDYLQSSNSSNMNYYFRSNNSDSCQNQAYQNQSFNQNSSNKFNNSYFEYQSNQTSYIHDYPSPMKPDASIPYNHNHSFQPNRSSTIMKNDYNSHNNFDYGYPCNNYYNRQINNSYYSSNPQNSFTNVDYQFKEQKQHYYSEFPDMKANGIHKDPRIQSKPPKNSPGFNDTVLQNRKRMSQASNNSTQKNSKRKKSELIKQTPLMASTQEFDPRTLLDEPKVLLLSPELQILSNILPPDPKPKFINPTSETGLPCRLNRNYFNDDSTVHDHWGQKYQSLSFDIGLFDSLTFDEIDKDFDIDLRNSSAERILYEYLYKLDDKKNSIINRKKLEENLFTISRDNCISRVSSSNLESDYFLPPSPDDQISNFMSKEPCSINICDRCTTPTLQTGTISVSSPLPSPITPDPPEHIIDLEIKKNILTSPTDDPGKTNRNELVVKVESLRNSANELVCINCSMQIIPRSRALYPSVLSATNQLNNSTSNAFCSFQCLKSKFNSKNSNPSKMGNPMGSLINSPSNVNSLSSSSDSNNPPTSVLSPSDHSFLNVPVIIQNYTPMGRIIKSAKKLCESSLNQSKIRRRSGDENVTYRKWAGTRWLRHTPNGLLSHLRGLSNKRMSKSEPNIDTQKAIFNSRVLRKTNSCEDPRTCKLCGVSGDGEEELLGRLLNYDSDVWLHLNCALWCFETYETVSGSLVDVKNSVERALKTECSLCKKNGAGLPCFFVNCDQVYHLKCAKSSNCSFYTDRGMFCKTHTSAENSKFILHSLSVPRKVYIERDEDNLVEKILQNDDSKRLRIGSFVLDSLGQLLPEQLSSGHFNGSNFIYPIGYSAYRFFWSSTEINKRSLYKCRIEETTKECRLCEKHSGSCKYSFCPKFFVDEYDENGNLYESHSGLSTRQAWEPTLKKIEKMRLDASGKILKFFSRHCNSDFLFGFHESHVVRGLESLPGIEYLSGYHFKFGRTQLISEMPLAINPSGCARSEPKLSTFVKRRNSQLPNYFNIASHTPTHSMSVSYQSSLEMSPTTKSIVQSKSLQYRKLKSEWKSNVLLSRSRIQGFGLYAAKDIERGSFIIEYIGETIRNEVANRRERLYESQNRGVYMFRADDEKIVDATMSGGLARYINHSCSPNCIAEVIIFDGGSHIVIIANRKIERGEELTYDYKFDFEEDKPNERIPCLCGSRNCRKWMN